MPKRAARGSVIRPVEPLAFMFHDDGAVPNNARLSTLYYCGCFDLAGAPSPERVIEAQFAKNGWSGMWRDGIFFYVHYHSQIHEGLGIARGRAKVRLGGEQGQEFDIEQGDAVLLPAGTGHQCLWASPDLVVIGAYPPEGRYDLCRGSKAEHDSARLTVPQVPVPPSDPAYGADGPLTKLWRK